MHWHGLGPSLTVSSFAQSVLPRAEFLTGRYHPRSGVFSTSAGGERINLDEMTIAQTFQAAGYATGAFGKWHNGMQYPYHPNGRGFQEYYGFCSGHWGNYFDPMLERNGRIVRGQGFIIDDLTTEAMAFMEHNREKPFFVYIPYNTPHSPMQVPSQWWNKFKDKELLMHHRNPSSEKISHIRAALAMRENIDWNVGRIVAKLEELDLTEETIIVYFCDNGPNGSRWNGDMKGRKGSTDEGGVRSPLLIHWPGKIAAGKTIPQISAAIDLLPTLADLAEIPVASKKPLDGISLKPLLAGQAKKWPDRMIYSHWRDRVSLRTQRFRMDHEGHLYDMRTDPGQRQDVAAEHPTVQQNCSEPSSPGASHCYPNSSSLLDHFLLDTAHSSLPRCQRVTARPVEIFNVLTGFQIALTSGTGRSWKIQSDGMSR